MSRRVMALVMNGVCVSAAVLAGTGGVSASYGDIIQHGGGQISFWPFGPKVVGQTFTADNTVTSLDSIGFFYEPGNESRPDAQPTLTLYQGAGYGGSVLGVLVQPELGARPVRLSN